MLPFHPVENILDIREQPLRPKNTSTSWNYLQYIKTQQIKMTKFDNWLGHTGLEYSLFILSNSQETNITCTATV